MSRRALSLLLIGILIPLTGAGVYWIRAVEEPRNAVRAPLPVAVEVLRVAPREFTHRLEALGTVQAIREAAVGAKISGPVAVVPPAIELGGAVGAGDLIVEIDRTPFEIEVRHKQALLERAEAQLRTRRAEIARQRALIGINREKLGLSRAEYDRLKSLFDAGGIAWVEVKTSELALRRTEEELERAESGLREAEAQRGVAEAEIGSARAELARAEEALTDTRVRAPFAGIIARKAVTLGEQVTPGTVLVSLADITAVKVLIRVPTDEVAALTPGIEAAVTPAGFPEPVRGRVGHIGPRADAETRTFPVEILVENRGPRRLLPGMFARVSVPVRRYPAAILIPRASLLPGEGEPAVFLADPGQGTARRRPVEVLRPFGSRLLIGRGLDAGDLLVVSGQRLLREGAAIRVAEIREATP